MKTIDHSMLNQKVWVKKFGFNQREFFRNFSAEIIEYLKICQKEKCVKID